MVECNGVGYFVSISLNTYEKIHGQENIKLLTHQIFREDGQFLYGFHSEEERMIFKLLLGVSGVGANTARVILSSMNPSGVVEAVSTNNVAILQKVKGIGQKTAERIIVDLRGKINKGVYISENISPMHNTLRQEALSALSQLGFTRQSAEKAVDQALKSGDITSVEEVIRLALKYL